jgi:hypothetical protein
MGPNSADKQFIATVAAGSAVAGAAMAVAAMKLLLKNDDNKRGGSSEAAAHNLHNPNFPTHSSMTLFNDDQDDIAIMARNDSKVILPHNHEEKMRRRVAQRVAVEQEHSTPRRSVTVKVPATSANFGPGCMYSFVFDADDGQ